MDLLKTMVTTEPAKAEKVLSSVDELAFFIMT
jgi:hypothetical protein